MRALHYKVSGTYRDGKADLHDYQVEGILPYNDYDVCEMHLQSRYVGRWIKDNPEYKAVVRHLRSVFVDDVQEIDHDFSFVGKDVREMSFDELQDLAVYKDLRLIPSERGDLREARAKAYADYMDKINGNKLNYKAEGFNVMAMPALVVDGESRRELPKKADIERVIQEESGGDVITFDALKKMADMKGIKYDGRASYDSLYQKVFSE